MKPLTERAALDLIRATATRSVPNCINLAAIDRILADVTPSAADLAAAAEKDGVVPASALFWKRAALNAATPSEAEFNMREAYNHVVGQLYAYKRDNDRLVDETHRWSEAVKRLEAERAADPSQLARIRAAAAPFVTHYANWMQEYPDDTASSVFPKHTIGQIRALHEALADAPTQIQCLSVKTGGQDFICPVADWTNSGLSMVDFLRNHAGVLGDDDTSLAPIFNIQLVYLTQPEIDNLPDYDG